MVPHMHISQLMRMYGSKETKGAGGHSAPTTLLAS
jgi:hypothetical protein